MFRISNKIFFIIIVSLFLSNCSNIKIVKISEDVKRIDKFNSEGNYQKSYYMKYNKTFSQWFSANCNNNICEYTNLALIRIENLSRDNQQQSVDNQQQSVDNQQQSVNNQQQSVDNQQQSVDNQEQNLEDPMIEIPLENNQCNDSYAVC
jgi:hypothetical protein